MAILHDSAALSPTDLQLHRPFKPLLLLPAPPRRLALPAPKIAGYLPAPIPFTAGGTMDSPLQRQLATVAIVPAKIEPPKPAKRVVVAEIVNPLDLIDIRRDPDAWWAEFERIHGPDKTIDEMDAEIEAEFPGWLKMKESWS